MLVLDASTQIVTRRFMEKICAVSHQVTNVTIVKDCTHLSKSTGSSKHGVLDQIAQKQHIQACKIEQIEQKKMSEAGRFIRGSDSWTSIRPAWDDMVNGTTANRAEVRRQATSARCTGRDVPTRCQSNADATVKAHDADSVRGCLIDLQRWSTW